MGTYEFLPHTADEKFRVVADSLEDGFSTCVAAFHEILLGKDEVKDVITKTFTINATKLRSLLYDFLNEFVFLFDDEDLLLPHVKSLKIIEKDSEYILEVTVSGDKRQNYELITEIKNMTYSDMKITELPSREWELIVVVDI